MKELKEETSTQKLYWDSENEIGWSDAWIELGVVEDEDDVPIYHVRDNGIGFDNENHELIFEAFQRLHTRAEFAGSGLGLATVERIVRRHGGRVWGEGVPGEGAVFCFTLESSS